MGPHLLGTVICYTLSSFLLMSGNSKPLKQAAVPIRPCSCSWMPLQLVHHQDLILSAILLLVISHLHFPCCLLNTMPQNIFLRALRFYKRASGTIVGLREGQIDTAPGPGLLLLPKQLCFYLFHLIRPHADLRDSSE